MRKELEAMALNDDDLDNVVGGCYVNTSMTIGQIVETDRNLASVLISAGIPVAGNKSMLGESLYEAASIRGIDAQALEDRMNDYLSGK